MLREFLAVALVAATVSACGIKGPLKPAPAPPAPPAADAAPPPAADDAAAPRKP